MRLIKSQILAALSSPKRRPRSPFAITSKLHVRLATVSHESVWHVVSKTANFSGPQHTTSVPSALNGKYSTLDKYLVAGSRSSTLMSRFSSMTVRPRCRRRQGHHHGWWHCIAHTHPLRSWIPARITPWHDAKSPASASFPASYAGSRA